MVAIPHKISRYGVGVRWGKIVVLIKNQRVIPHSTAITNHVKILFSVILITVWPIMDRPPAWIPYYPRRGFRAKVRLAHSDQDQAVQQRELASV